MVKILNDQFTNAIIFDLLLSLFFNESNDSDTVPAVSDTALMKECRSDEADGATTVIVLALNQAS